MGVLFPILLAIHIALAVALLLPSIALPFLLRGSIPPQQRPSPATRLLLWLQSSGSVVIGLGLAITGGALLLLLGPQLLGRPWLIVALVIYAANLLVAAFVARPNLRSLLGLSGDAEAWRHRARRQRWIAYAMAGATGVIAFLMSVKPDLW